MVNHVIRILVHVMLSECFGVRMVYVYVRGILHGMTRHKIAHVDNINIGRESNVKVTGIMVIRVLRYRVDRL